jgi:GntR family transcriptional regulator/MocR family aminotransferase
MCQLLLDPGDAAWLEEPAYPGARAALVSAGARPVAIPVDDEGLDVAAGEARAPQARLAFVTPSHQFPLGVQMSLPRRLALLRWATRAGAWILEDDYDSEFRHEARSLPCLHGLDPDGRVVYVGSFSKSLCPALRLGFLVVPTDLRTQVVHARRIAEHHPPTLEQAALAEFMARGDYERHLRRMRVAYRERLAAVTDALHTFCGGALRMRPVRMGLHLVADLDGVDATDVANEAMARGVETMPLSAYATPGQKPPNALVLGLGAVPPDMLVRGAQTLAEAIHEVRRRSRARPAPRARAHA